MPTPSETSTVRYRTAPLNTRPLFGTPPPAVVREFDWAVQDTEAESIVTASLYSALWLLGDTPPPFWQPPAPEQVRDEDGERRDTDERVECFLGE